MSEANLNGADQDGTTAISDEAIARRAYEIWESRGCPEGDGSENWEAAREQLSLEVQQPEPLSAERCGPLRRFWARLTNQAA